MSRPARRARRTARQRPPARGAPASVLFPRTRHAVAHLGRRLRAIPIESRAHILVALEIRQTLEIRPRRCIRTRACRKQNDVDDVVTTRGDAGLERRQLDAIVEQQIRTYLSAGIWIFAPEDQLNDSTGIAEDGGFRHIDRLDAPHRLRTDDREKENNRRPDTDDGTWDRSGGRRQDRDQSPYHRSFHSGAS